MATTATNITLNMKNSTLNTSDFTPLRSENYMILSTTYPLNNSDTKRIQVGLRAVNEDGAFELSIKLSGNSSSGIYFDRDTWRKFQENVELAGDYLRGNFSEIPEPVYINNIVLHFTSAYGARAIMLSYRNHSLQKKRENSEAAAQDDSGAPPVKKRKSYATPIVMQRSSFEGLENIIQCINARHIQLDSLVNLVNDCTGFLITEIELDLPNRIPDEDMVKQTLAENYKEIQRTVQRQLKDLNFLDAHFEILFQELTSLYLNEIVRLVIMNKTS